MAKHITQRELRNDSGTIMRRVDGGESFVITRNGVPVGELRPLRRLRFVNTDLAREAFRNASTIDPRRFRRDVDRALNQDPKPRA